MQTREEFCQAFDMFVVAEVRFIHILQVLDAQNR